MGSRRPRLVFGAVVFIVVAALGIFAALLLDNRASQRQSLEERFHSAAGLTAAMVESLFGSSTEATAARNAQELGGERIAVRALQRRVEADNLDYAVVLDARGGVLAATAAADATVLQRLTNTPGYAAPVIAGTAPYRLSGFVDAGGLESANAYKAASGERRVLVSGFSTTLLSGFLTTYLSRLPSSVPQRNFLVDQAGRVIASSEESEVGSTVGAPAGHERDAAAVIGSTQWRVLLRRDEADLYAGFGMTTQWLLFGVFALTGAWKILLLWRVLRGQEALRGAYAEIEHSNAELAESNARLARTNAELLRSNSELEQFAAVASHDLQEPLRKVQTFGDVLERRYADELPEPAREHIGKMRSAAQRMSGLIEDLLRFSRVTTAARPAERVELEALAHEVVTDLDVLVRETGATVLVGELPAVDADPLQVRQLLQNLIANGLKFHKPDVAPLVQVRPCAATAPGRVGFEVADNGIGFEPEYEERIFRVFERLHSRDLYAGTGIGLALCRKIVERHGGTISAEGRPGEGAVFRVELPRARTAAAAEAREVVHA